MKHLFLIGHPLGHSLSPVMHNAAIQALGLDWDYDLLDILPHQLPETVARLRQEDCVGANVTIPYKQAIIPFLDELAPNAAKIGAVNTIVKQGSKLVGENTDVHGVSRSLIEADFDARGARAVVLGAGGAARAVVFALAGLGVSEITILNRTGARAEELARTAGRDFPRLPLAVNALDTLGRATLVVNATPVGMFPRIESSPMPPGHQVPAQAVAFDLVYQPRETRFLREAERTGALAIGGLETLLHQGAAALTLWTGADAPLSSMRRALDQAQVIEETRG
jgi:shikimate dehydrogenase